MSSEKNTKFSEFIRNATDEERARVYGEVMDKACEMQKAVMGGESELLHLIGDYWDVAYAEGRDGRKHDTRSAVAQKCWAKITHCISTLARQLAEARDHAARLDHDLDVVMSERDAAQDALQETHIALGGDGEWVAKIPEEEPPHSGDLHVDTPALAAEVFAAKEAAERRAAEESKWLDWIARQGDEFSFGVIVDAPGDGDYYVRWMGDAYATGKTFRQAIDAAIAAGEK